MDAIDAFNPHAPRYWSQDAIVFRTVVQYQDGIFNQTYAPESHLDALHLPLSATARENVRTLRALLNTHWDGNLTQVAHTIGVNPGMVHRAIQTGALDPKVRKALEDKLGQTFVRPELKFAHTDPSILLLYPHSSTIDSSDASFTVLHPNLSRDDWTYTLDFEGIDGITVRTIERLPDRTTLQIVPPAWRDVILRMLETGTHELEGKIKISCLEDKCDGPIFKSLVIEKYRDVPIDEASLRGHLAEINELSGKPDLVDKIVLSFSVDESKVDLKTLAWARAVTDSWTDVSMTGTEFWMQLFDMTHGGHLDRKLIDELSNQVPPEQISQLAESWVSHKLKGKNYYSHWSRVDQDDTLSQEPWTKHEHVDDEAFAEALRTMASEPGPDKNNLLEPLKLNRSTLQFDLDENLEAPLMSRWRYSRITNTGTQPIELELQHDEPFVMIEISSPMGWSVSPEPEDAIGAPFRFTMDREESAWVGVRIDPSKFPQTEEPVSDELRFTVVDSGTTALVTVSVQRRALWPITFTQGNRRPTEKTGADSRFTFGTVAKPPELTMVGVAVLFESSAQFATETEKLVFFHRRGWLGKARLCQQGFLGQQDSGRARSCAYRQCARS